MEKIKIDLSNKIIYAFGDSIINGHVYNKSFLDQIVEMKGMYLSNFAVNGATLTRNDKSLSIIIDQVMSAPQKSPHYVIFNGGINDIGINSEMIDLKNIKYSLECTISCIRNKWKNAIVLYTHVHRMCSRDWNKQIMLYETTKQVCKKLGISTIDIFGESELDTRIDEQRKRYTFDSLDENSLPSTNGTGTHPNLLGYYSFYVPLTLKQLVFRENSK